MKKHWENYVKTVCCEECKEKFDAYVYNLKRGWGKFCSRSCSKKGNNNLKGKIKTVETKEKISESLKKKYESGELVSPLRTLGLMGLKGEKAMNWQGGKTFVGQKIRTSLEYKNWHKEALQEQNFTCAFCKKVGGKLEVDHVRPFSTHPNQRLDPSNARVLCVDCHKRVTAFKKAEGIDLRGSFVDALIEIAEKDKRLVVITCDVGFKFLDKFAEKFPNRYYNLGITEQSAMVIAGAMALSGLRPVFYSMINFSVFRPYEMLRNIVCYHDAPVIVAGVSGSKAYRFLGLSHNISKNEDINVIWHFPNLRISLPWNEEETKQAVLEAYNSEKPAYIRL